MPAQPGSAGGPPPTRAVKDKATQRLEELEQGADEEQKQTL
jgi:hypothetical protein